MYPVFTRMPGESYRRDSGLCCCIYVTCFERQLTPLCVDSTSLGTQTGIELFFCTAIDTKS